MVMVNPKFWNPISDYNNTSQFFNKHMENKVNHFGRIVEVNGVEIKGILDKKYFDSTVWNFWLDNGWLV